jgi:hypothetical protein
MTSVTDFIRARLDEREAGTRMALRTEDYGTSERDLDLLAAHRRLLEIHAPYYQPNGPTRCKRCTPSQHLWPCETVLVLASIDSTHEDYREEWGL